MEGAKSEVLGNEQFMANQSRGQKYIGCTISKVPSLWKCLYTEVPVLSYSIVRYWS